MAKNLRRARTRLQQAALELFREQGYDQTTAAQVAERAGVTERTFFRYFSDKREVLFGGEDVLQDALTASIADAPAELDPLDTLFRAFRSVRPVIEEYRPFTKPRHEIISATPALFERELAKTSGLSDALASALVERGLRELPASLAAQAGMAALRGAVVSWFDDPDTELGDHLDLAFRDLRSLIAESG